jgi:hypothetical protein
MPAVPKEILEDKDTKKEQPEPLQELLETGDVRQVFRTLSATGQFMEGYDVFPVEVVNDYLNSFLRDGYKLIYVQHVRTVKNREELTLGEQMLYILVKQ